MENSSPTEVGSIDSGKEITTKQGLNAIWQAPPYDTVRITTDGGGWFPDGWGKYQKSCKAGFDVSGKIFTGIGANATPDFAFGVS
jgi:hypothetical protein